jgi:hypothetical protein
MRAPIGTRLPRRCGAAWSPLIGSLLQAAKIELETPMYDALYAWCQGGRDRLTNAPRSQAPRCSRTTEFPRRQPAMRTNLPRAGMRGGWVAGLEFYRATLGRSVASGRKRYQGCWPLGIAKSDAECSS